MVWLPILGIFTAIAVNYATQHTQIKLPAWFLWLGVFACGVAAVVLHEPKTDDDSVTQQKLLLPPNPVEQDGHHGSSDRSDKTASRSRRQGPKTHDSIAVGSLSRVPAPPVEEIEVEPVHGTGDVQASIDDVREQIDIYAQIVWRDPNDRAAARQYAELMDQVLDTHDAQLACESLTRWKNYATYEDCKEVQRDVLESVYAVLPRLQQQCGKQIIDEAALMRCTKR